MNKKIAMWIAAVLLVVLCVSLAACGKNKPEPTSPGTTQSGDTTAPGTTGGEETEGTEGTQPDTQPQSGNDATQPTLESDTEVGSGRGEGSSASQQQTTPAVTDPTTGTLPDEGLTLNYQQYMALSGAEQQKLFDKYFSDNPLGFATWFQKIKAEYDDGKVEIEATGPVDIGDYINP